MNPREPIGQAPAPGSFRFLRWVLIALGAAIAAVLLLRGSYVLGLLIAAAVIVRIFYVSSITRRRRALAPLRDPQSRGVLRKLARSEWLVAAGVLDLDPADLRRAFAEGRSLADMATNAGVPVDRLVEAVVLDASAELDRKVTQGELPADRARRLKARLPVWADRVVHYVRY